jgi:hypothetical protein
MEGIMVHAKIGFSVRYPYPMTEKRHCRVWEDGDPVWDFEFDYSTGVFTFPDKATRWSNFYRRGIQALDEGGLRL